MRITRVIPVMMIAFLGSNVLKPKKLRRRLNSKLSKIACGFKARHSLISAEGIIAAFGDQSGMSAHARSRNVVLV